MTATFAGLDSPLSFRSPSQPIAATDRMRRISPQAGRALELLGHAIEYLTDEYIRETEHLSAGDPQVAAIQLLMALNREVYFECPVIATFGERLRSLLGIPHC